MYLGLQLTSWFLSPAISCLSHKRQLRTPLQVQFHHSWTPSQAAGEIREREKTNCCLSHVLPFISTQSWCRWLTASGLFPPWFGKRKLPNYQEGLSPATHQGSHHSWHICHYGRFREGRRLRLRSQLHGRARSPEYILYILFFQGVPWDNDFSAIALRSKPLQVHLHMGLTLLHGPDSQITAHCLAQWWWTFRVSHVKNA